MKPRVEALDLNFETATASAVVLVPAGGRDTAGHYPFPLEHLELFVEQWAGLHGDLLSLRFEEEEYPCIYLMSIDRAGKAQRYEVVFDLNVPESRALIEAVDWRELQ